MHDGSHTASVSAAGDHAEVAGLELDEVHDLVGVDVEADRVVDLDHWVRIADGAAVRGVEVRHVLGSRLDGLDAAQLVLGLLVGDPVHGEAALDIVDEAEVLIGLLDLNDIHEAAGVARVGAALAVDLDEALLHDEAHLLGRQRVLQPVPEEQRDRHGLPQLVGPGGRARREHASQLVQHPCFGRCQTLQVLLRTASHGDSESGRGLNVSNEEPKERNVIVCSKLAKATGK